MNRRSEYLTAVTSLPPRPSSCVQTHCRGTVRKSCNSRRGSLCIPLEPLPRFEREDSVPHIIPGHNARLFAGYAPRPGMSFASSYGYIRSSTEAKHLELQGRKRKKECLPKGRKMVARSLKCHRCRPPSSCWGQRCRRRIPRRSRRRRTRSRPRRPRPGRSCRSR